MSDYKDFMKENMRLAILRYLNHDNDYTLNDSVLQSGLEHIGFNISREALRADLVALKEMGVIKYKELMDGKIYVISITERGQDHVQGRIVIPGIKRPTPGRED